jgi:hypothetical protein
MDPSERARLEERARALAQPLEEAGRVSPEEHKVLHPERR